MTTSNICMLKKKNFLHVSENPIHNNKINTYKMRRRSRGVNSNSQQVKVTTWFEIQCYAHRKHERSELALIWHWKKLIWMTLTFFLECNFISRYYNTNIQPIILLPHTYPIQIIVNIVKSITSSQSCTGLRAVGWSSKTWRRTRRTLWATEACFGSLSSDGGLANWRWRRQRQWWELFCVCSILFLLPFCLTRCQY